MRTPFASVCLTALATLSFCTLAGCGSGSPTGGTPTEPAGHYEGDGHDHSGDAGETHPTEGPHGGHLIELGDEEYHAELTHDEATQTVTVYLLDGAGESPVSVPLDRIMLQLFRDGQFVDYALMASSGQAGAASEFEVVDAGLCDALCSDDELKGRIQVTIDGTSYSDAIENAAHAGHEEEGHDTDELGHEGHDH